MPKKEFVPGHLLIVIYLILFVALLTLKMDANRQDDLYPKEQNAQININNSIPNASGNSSIEHLTYEEVIKKFYVDYFALVDQWEKGKKQEWRIQDKTLKESPYVSQKTWDHFELVEKDFEEICRNSEFCSRPDPYMCAQNTPVSYDIEIEKVYVTDDEIQAFIKMDFEGRSRGPRVTLEKTKEGWKISRIDCPSDLEELSFLDNGIQKKVELFTDQYDKISYEKTASNKYIFKQEPVRNYFLTFYGSKEKFEKENIFEKNSDGNQAGQGCYLSDKTVSVNEHMFYKHICYYNPILLTKSGKYEEGKSSIAGTNCVLRSGNKESGESYFLFSAIAQQGYDACQFINQNIFSLRVQ